ncbi:SCO family protein [Bacillus sp. CGMCC 1.16607]|uniref:SCO family protein n=1 Tax=Bacillus sp. CGMCC 1.16607 TaxID=3351842 RepID=UPI003636FE49
MKKKCSLLKRISLVKIFVILIILSSCGQKTDSVNDAVKDFTYTNQNGKSFGLKDLSGKVWIANFIFTKCEDVCPPMTYNMKKLQTMSKKEEIENIQFVSFSVDPTVDSSDVLKKFGESFQVDFVNWNFLTGYSQKDIEYLALDSFKSVVKKPDQGDQVIHETQFYLVDKEGKVYKNYTGLNEIPYDEIISDIKTLQD